jgi:hypothetical protein
VCVGIRYPILGQAPGGHGDGWHGEAHDLHHTHYPHRRFFFEVNVCKCVYVCVCMNMECVGGAETEAQVGVGIDVLGGGSWQAVGR